MPTRDELNAAAKLIIGEWGMGRQGFKKRAREAKRRRSAAGLNPILSAGPEKRAPHFVYVICADSGPVKIGIAADPRKRLSGVQTGHPQRLVLHFAAEVADAATARRVEAHCHAQLAACRLSGEWFDCDPDTAADLVKSTSAQWRQDQAA